VKDALECLWWLSRTSWPKANNQNVLQEYSPDRQRLLERGYRARERPSGHRITRKFKDNSGSNPPNVLLCGNNDANGHSLSRCHETGRQPHPARFPAALPLFFVRFLTDPGDRMLDPFAGSHTTGEVCEAEGHRWVAGGAAGDGRGLIGRRPDGTNEEEQEGDDWGPVYAATPDGRRPDHRGLGAASPQGKTPGGRAVSREVPSHAHSSPA
jgi:site-specific DNA-methyltransferase (cytosine-N4-specific)